MSEDTNLGDDPFDDPAWQRAELMVGAPPRPVKGYVTCPLEWLARMRSVVCSVDQLLVAQMLYRQCLMLRCCTVGLSNGELAKLRISRLTKYRTLAHLKEAGAITIEARNGRAVRVTLHWFP
jgi:hypothetical protein